MSLRQRKEIQKMSRRITCCIAVPQFLGGPWRIVGQARSLRRPRRPPFGTAKLAALALFLPLVANAAIFPETLSNFHRVSDAPLTPPTNQAIWDEYGLREAETAQYEGDGQKFTATAYRLQDPTGALGAFDWLRSSKSKPSAIAKLSAETPTGTILVHGNYVLSFEGYRPTNPLLDALASSLKQVDTSPLPVLIDYLPTEGLIPNSERYIEGPAALAKFDPGIPPSAAAFHLSAEAQVADFSAPGGDLKLAIFSYPTPQIARVQTGQFEQLAGAMVKRAGPLVAVIQSPANRDAAERLLSLIRYQADITLDQRVNTRRDNIGNLVINAFVLIGILLCFTFVGGLAFGGLRLFMRRGGRGEAADAMIVLHLQDR